MLLYLLPYPLHNPTISRKFGLDEGHVVLNHSNWPETFNIKSNISHIKPPLYTMVTSSSNSGAPNQVSADALCTHRL